MSARSLPIWSRVVCHYPFLRYVLFAQPFCKILCGMYPILGVTPEEKDKIADVANGGAWV